MDYSPEQVHDVIQQARELREKRKLRDAIAMLKELSSLQESAEVYFELGKTYFEQLNTKETIRSLQKCLELEPGNIECRKLYDLALIFSSRYEMSLSNVSCDRRWEPLPAPEKMVERIEFPTIYQVLWKGGGEGSPLRFWSIVIVAWFWISIGLELLFSVTVIKDPGSLFMKTLLFPKIVDLVVSYLLVYSTFAIREKILELKIPLTFQLKSMNIDVFERSFFKPKLETMFGIALEISDNDSSVTQYVLEKHFLLKTIFFGVVVGTATFLSVVSHMPDHWNFILIASRWCDYCFRYMFYYPVFRIGFGLTNMIREYSRLDLKPMLIRELRDGITSITPVINFFVQTAVFIYCFFWGANCITLIIRGQQYQFPEVVASVVVSCFFLAWTFHLIQALRAVALKAKQEILMRYTREMESSFNMYLADPGDDGTVKRFEKLLQNKKTVEKLPTWPFSIFQSLLLVLANMVLIGVNIACYFLFPILAGNLLH